MMGQGRLLAGLSVAVLLALGVWLGLPRVLAGLGLHPHHVLPELDLTGRRALIITTSHGELGEGGPETGVFASEMTAPYYAFLDAGMQVDLASVLGGEIPIEPISLRWPIASESDRRFLEDERFQQQVRDSKRIDDVDMGAYDIVFLAGGWGAAYDLGTSEAVGRQMSAAWSSGAVVGGVCHGPLGLLQAKAADGRSLIAGRRLTAVTDKQIRELGITQTPQHPERELRAAGVVFESRTALRDIFASHVVADGRIVTGQNQNSGPETAQRMMEIVLVGGPVGARR